MEGDVQKATTMLLILKQTRITQTAHITNVIQQSKQKIQIHMNSSTENTTKILPCFLPVTPAINLTSTKEIPGHRKR